MEKIELLAPVGDFDCLRAAVQNGADAVYFGSGNFNARASANNFSGEKLEEAISYAKIRNVTTHLTLNTLIKDTEWEDAIDLAKKAYVYGIDAIIVQDLGLATYLIKHFPDLPIHGSTQMTIHNLEGALGLQTLGFKRAVLARELSLSDIEYICMNSNIEIETFIHGALCISYSGQCLLSSMIGARSGNRGKCAQPCRLPYELLQKKESKILSLSKGHLMSPKDLCGLDFIPDLIKVGVKSFKIEGRMKSPEYVATVTRIYRKYIDLALSENPYSVDKQDKKELLQIFNRGGFSTGHLSNSSNRSLIFKDQPGNIGLYIGNISNYHPVSKRVDMKLLEDLSIGDTISFQNEHSKYTVSELMQKNKNIPNATSGMPVTFGRMKGNIAVGDRVYKISSKALSSSAIASFQEEHKKIPLRCHLKLLADTPVSLETDFSYHTKNYHIKVIADAIPVPAKNVPITPVKVKEQLQKTTNAPFSFSSISITLGDSLFLPSFTAILNELRRKTIEEVTSKIKESFHRNLPVLEKELLPFSTYPETREEKYQVSILLNFLKEDYDYTKLENVDKVYIPLKYFTMKKYTPIIQKLANRFSIYLYMPSIVRANYKNLILANLESALRDFPVKGCVLSNISNVLAIKKYHHLFPEKKYEHVANYTLNVYNRYTIKELLGLNIKNITISPELDKNTIQQIPRNNSYQKEAIVYGKTPVMTTNYCFLGQTNKCYPTCGCRCQEENTSYYLKDRLGLEFRIVPDNIQTVTTIYNSKILSIPASDLNIDCARIDILEESIAEINHIIQTVREGKRLEGTSYTNGNFNRIV